MTDPETDADLKKAIDDRTIPVVTPPPPPVPIDSRRAEEVPADVGESGLGQNVDDFEIDVPPPEGI
ncbi:MAG TPA: hypothetical protein VMZ71_13055 [Gemmataceae bacterium]|nr:hypothetical protein [Gemmataceae bacterium]